LKKLSEEMLASFSSIVSFHDKFESASLNFFTLLSEKSRMISNLLSQCLALLAKTTTGKLSEIRLDSMAVSYVCCKVLVRQWSIRVAQ
jgi:hypothetical protein